MEEFKGLQFTEFVESDVELLTPIMKRAFDEDTKRHLNRESGGPPGYDNGEFLRKYALHKDSSAFKVLKAGNAIGAVIVWITGSNVNFLGNIFIDPEVQDRGLGLTVWHFIEAKFPNTIEWGTETPGFSKRNHNFYVNKCGFHIIRIEKPGDIDKESYIFRKIMG